MQAHAGRVCCAFAFVLIFLALPAIAPAANLISNPSFESNTTEWQGSGSTLSRVAAASVPAGSYALGAVVVNPTTSAVTVNLGGTFSGSGHTDATSLPMPATSGLILKGVYSWSGFFSPISNESAQGINLVHAGDLIMVGFGLNSERGLNITSTPVSCPAAWTLHSVPAGGAGATPGLSYSASISRGARAARSRASVQAGCRG